MSGFGKLLAKLCVCAPIIGKLVLRIQHFGQRAFARAPSRFREVDIMLILGDQCVGGCDAGANPRDRQHLIDYARSEEHTSELQSLMRISYAVFCLKKKKT